MIRELGFGMLFFDATRNADEIRFDISNFSTRNNPVTAREMRIIKDNPKLLKKTRWWDNGDEKIWNPKGGVHGKGMFEVKKKN